MMDARTIRRLALLLITCPGWMCVHGQQAALPLAADVADATGTGGGRASAPAMPATTTTVRVEGDAADGMDVADAETPAVGISQRQILSSAGTFGDFTRYLQVLPGVMWTSDLNNDVLVRGGHPAENLFVLDGVEIPNMNHFALPGSTGGFTSMLDGAAVGSMSMRVGVYDAGYSTRLSSLVEIRTRAPGEAERAGEVSVGIAGAGGVVEQKLAQGRGSVLVSAHRSVVSLFTNDIGIEGVPTYENALLRAEMDLGERDRVTVLSLSGDDSITIEPCPSFTSTMSTLQTEYSGWRTTGALSWRHLYSATAVGNLTASYSLARQKVGQEQQSGFLYDAEGRVTCKPAQLTPEYEDDSRNGLAALDYRAHAGGRGWLVSAGASGKLSMPDVDVAQPAGELSPFSAGVAASDAVSFRRRLASGQTAAFVEGETGAGTRWRAMGGVRAETFAIAGTYAVDPRASVSYRLNGRQSVRASAGISSQLPPLVNFLSFAGNRTLRPTEVRQAAVGARIWQGGWGTVDLEAYRKHYVREPVATEYPQLMLANMVDTLGQAFVWLPLASAGTADAEGIELSVRAHWQNRLQVMGSAARSAASYRALDGVKRPGSYDVPTVANAMGNLRLPLGLQLDFRESYASGRLYTPFDVADSKAQMRGIFDLTQVNARRGPYYNRLDVELERDFRAGRGLVTVHAGGENIFNRGNFLGYVWLDLCQPGWPCNNAAGVPETKVDQMGRYPVGSVRWKF